MRTIYAIMLAILLLAAGCSDSYCPSLEKVVTVGESDFYEISLSGLKPKEIDLGLMGIIGVRYCDSLLVVTTLGTDRLLHLYDRHCLEHKGDFFTKGRGPKELLFPLFGSSLSLNNEAGSYMMRFVDRYSDRLVEVNLSESIKNKDLVLKEREFKSDEELFTALPLDESRCFMKRMVQNGTCLERYVQDVEGTESMSQPMLKLNSCQIGNNDGYNINLFAGIVGYDSSRHLIVEAMSLLNLVQVYPVEGEGGYTLCYGKTMPDIRVLEKQSPQLCTYHTGLSLNDSYFSVMYTDERVSGATKEIHGYSWDGRPLFRIPLPSNIAKYDIDCKTGSLLTVDEEDHILEYNIEYLKSAGETREDLI